jgi:hypothetical protein
VLFLFTRLTVVGNGRRLVEQTWFNFGSDSQIYEGAVHLFASLSRSDFWVML